MSTNPLQSYDDVKEQAPLYAPPPQPTLPGPEAHPADIREFLTNALSASRGLSVDDASAIASKWRLGTGRELRSYPPKMYLEIFGPEDGWCVYKEVKTRLLKQTHLGPTPPESLMFLSVLCVVLAGISLYVAWSRRHLRWLAGMAFVLFVWGAFGNLFAATRPPRTVDELVNESVEKELADLMANGDTIKKK